GTGAGRTQGVSHLVGSRKSAFGRHRASGAGRLAGPDGGDVRTLSALKRTPTAIGRYAFWGGATNAGYCAGVDVAAVAVAVGRAYPWPGAHHGQVCLRHHLSLE